jgi:hypothetical protein
MMVPRTACVRNEKTGRWGMDRTPKKPRKVTKKPAEDNIPDFTRDMVIAVLKDINSFKNSKDLNLGSDATAAEACYTRLALIKLGYNPEMDSSLKWFNKSLKKYAKDTEVKELKKGN